MMHPAGFQLHAAPDLLPHPRHLAAVRRRVAARAGLRAHPCAVGPAQAAVSARSDARKRGAGHGGAAREVQGAHRQPRGGGGGVGVSVG
eukprot:357126-Rhodomonas_salina.2